MLIGDRYSANTYPSIQVRNPGAQVGHGAPTSKIGEDQLFYFAQRGIDGQAAVSMIINGFCKDVFRQWPMEFAVEASQLLGMKLEGSVG
jgi:Fe-S cluster assembly protein SufB